MNATTEVAECYIHMTRANQDYPAATPRFVLWLADGTGGAMPKKELLGTDSLLRCLFGLQADTLPSEWRRKDAAAWLLKIQNAGSCDIQVQLTPEQRAAW